MGILGGFEKRLEGAVEGFFARAFRSGLQPIELAKAMQRYAGNSKQVGLSTVFVPNAYRFRLSPDDAERFAGFGESLRRELADVLRRTADERGWELRGPVRVRFEADEDIPVGTYELAGRVEAATEPPNRPKGGQGGNEADRGHTQILPAPPRTAPVLRIVEGPEPDREVRLDGDDEVVIGRLPSCDLTINDPSVSRRHARVHRSGDDWTIEDLGSTNGLRVNGRNHSQATLREGDDIELGSVRLVFARER